MQTTPITAFPFYVTRLIALSILICIPIIALSVVNFGMLSIWLNASLAALILAHHTAFFTTSWISRKRFLPKKVAIDDADSVYSQAHSADAEPPVAYGTPNIAGLIFLAILNALAFSVMVDITTRGAKASTLPAERVGSHPWNIKIEVAQTSVLGVELLVLGTILALCTLGSQKFTEEKERREAEVECGMISPVVRLLALGMTAALDADGWLSVAVT